MKIEKTALFDSPPERVRAFFMVVLWVTVMIVMPVSTSLALDGTPGDDVIINSVNLPGEDIKGLAGDDTITNNGTVGQHIWGNAGNDTITNNGTVGWHIIGGLGNDTITNNGTVGLYIYGGLGNDTITNNGTVGGYIFGDSGDDTITNNGTVGQHIWGNDGNDTITNSGTVGWDIRGGDNDDTLQLAGACNVGGSITAFERFFKTGAGTATVGGNLNDGDLGYSFIESYNGIFPLINVTGTAQTGGDLEPYGYFPAGDSVLIAASGLAGVGFNPVIDNSSVLDFTVASVGNDVVLTVTRRSYMDVLSGLKGNDRALTGALDDIADDATGDLAYVIGRIDFMTPSDIEAALHQLWPTTLSGLEAVSFNNISLFNNTVMDRLRNLQQGFYAADQPGFLFAGDPRIFLASAGDTTGLGVSKSGQYNTGAYGRMLFSHGNQESSSEHPGYDYNTAGFVFGMDKSFSPDFIGGVDIGYVSSDIFFKDTGESRGSVETLHAGVYGTRIFDRLHIDASLSGGYLWYESDRRIVFSTIDRNAKAEFNGWELDAHIGAGYDFNPAGFIITPEATLDYAHVHTDGYTEDHAGDLNLHVDSINNNSLATILGVRAAYPFQLDEDLMFIPSIRAAWKHEFLRDENNVRTYLTGAPSESFAIELADPERDSALIGVGLLLKGTRASLDVHYNGDISSNFDTHSIIAEIRYAF